MLYASCVRACVLLSGSLELSWYVCAPYVGCYERNYSIGCWCVQSAVLAFSELRCDVCICVVLMQCPRVIKSCRACQIAYAIQTAALYLNKYDEVSHHIAYTVINW